MLLFPRRRRDEPRLTNLVLLHALGTVLHVGLLDTLSLGQRDEGVLTATDDHDVLDLGAELMSLGVLEVDDVRVTDVVLTVADDTDATDGVTTGDHGDVTVGELGEL